MIRIIYDKLEECGYLPKTNTGAWVLGKLWIRPMATNFIAHPPTILSYLSSDIMKYFHSAYALGRLISFCLPAPQVPLFCYEPQNSVNANHHQLGFPNTTLQQCVPVMVRTLPPQTKLTPPLKLLQHCCIWDNLPANIQTADVSGENFHSSCLSRLPRA